MLKCVSSRIATPALYFFRFGVRYKDIPAFVVPGSFSGFRNVHYKIKFVLYLKKPHWFSMPFLASRKNYYFIICITFIRTCLYPVLPIRRPTSLGKQLPWSISPWSMIAIKSWHGLATEEEHSNTDFLVISPEFGSTNKIWVKTRQNASVKRIPHKKMKKI